MGFSKVNFRIIEARECPKYKFGDIFAVTGVALFMHNKTENSFITTTVVHSPEERESCKILCGDITRIIIEYERADKIPDCMISCSGCTGSIRLEHSLKISFEDEHFLEDNTAQLKKYRNMLPEFPFFKSIDRKDLDNILKYFKLKTFDAGSIILRKGDPGGNLYIVASGKIEIINDVGLQICSLGHGEVFGEMSLICEEDVGATVRAFELCEILYLDNKHFNKVLQKYPSLYLYFTRLLAKRLSDSNKVRGDDYSSGMIGKLEEIPPEALFQTLNSNQKTGILTITQLPKGTARFSLRNGALIKAKYGDKSGESAFYEVLHENEGRFKFTPGLPPEDFETPEIGYFMKLLMEGLRRVDEIPPSKKNN